MYSSLFCSRRRLRHCGWPTTQSCTAIHWSLPTGRIRQGPSNGNGNGESVERQICWRRFVFPESRGIERRPEPWQGRLLLVLALLGSLVACFGVTRPGYGDVVGAVSVLRSDRSPTAACPFLCRSGDRFQTTTSGTGCSYSRRLRCLFRWGYCFGGEKDSRADFTARTIQRKQVGGTRNDCSDAVGDSGQLRRDLAR